MKQFVKFINEAEIKKFRTPKGSISFNKSSPEFFKVTYNTTAPVKHGLVEKWAVIVELEKNMNKWIISNTAFQITFKDGDQVTVEAGGAGKSTFPRKTFEGRYGKQLFNPIIKWIEADVQDYLLGLESSDKEAYKKELKKVS